MSWDIAKSKLHKPILEMEIPSTSTASATDLFATNEEPNDKLKQPRKKVILSILVVARLYLDETNPNARVPKMPTIEEIPFHNPIKCREIPHETRYAVISSPTLNTFR
mmetsp:Transcript_20894/g.59928  ORF Transcript_20894/g.59928 Transcript_20894/m.59928 type:complete len:108 (+) Transcript_20894:1016-1339(+)